MTKGSKLQKQKLNSSLQMKEEFDTLILQMDHGKSYAK